MPGNKSRARKASAGLQLLSPTLQQSIQNSTSTSTSKLSSSHPAEFFGWSTTPPASHNALDLNASFVAADTKDQPVTDPAEFDFDGFTLASVRVSKKTEEDAARTSSRVVRATSTGCDQQPNGTADYCAFYYDNVKPNPLSCSVGSVRTTTTTEDFEMSRRLQQHSLRKQDQRVSVASRHGCSDDAIRGTFQMSATAAAAGFPMAKQKELTAVVLRGWLQKRKGLVLKRWKPFYCLFKSDNSLCLYSSEDTVNGKLEQRYQVLRVVLTDKNDSFHIIGVDSEGSPRREEFRASVSPEWARWFQVLGRFFDSSSMEQALVRKPELTLNATFIDNDQLSIANNQMLEFQSYDERRSYFSQRKQFSAAVCDSFDGSGDDKTSTVSSFSGSSVPSVGVNNKTNEAATAHTKAGPQKLSDCPMIERKSQATVPILETRASESKRDAGVAASFSWTK
ncbi:unnamed protein product [Phytophthora lilii]|uniref:Unnamed protein product n=1 Tax=Phytophthora lilii TaxID=2077276 RepID=A0A9W6TW73_9STRA|nr:unnamed protein product [Phytophthora lilii]